MSGPTSAAAAGGHRPRRFPNPHRSHRELRDAHAEESRRLAAIDTDLEEVLARRRGCLDTLAELRSRINVRYTANHIRRGHHVDEPPVPPAPADAAPLEGIDLRTVCLTLLRRHGPQRLRDLHGLLHCYGYHVASTRPVQRLGDAMAYELRCGRARRAARGTYAAVADAPEPPRPGWLGPTPQPAPTPLPWTRPDPTPDPPHVDPRVADDPELWSGRAWPDPDPLPVPLPEPEPEPEPEATADRPPPPAPAPEHADPRHADPTQPPSPADGHAPPPAHPGDDSSTNRSRVRGAGDAAERGGDRRRRPGEPAPDEPP